MLVFSDFQADASVTAKKPTDKSSQAATELHFEDHFLTDSIGLWTLPMPVETKAGEKKHDSEPTGYMSPHLCGP